MHIFVLNGKVDNFQVPASKSGFYSERADEFVISPNKQTKLFSWAEILIFFFILNGPNHVK